MTDVAMTYRPAGRATPGAKMAKLEMGATRQDLPRRVSLRCRSEPGRRQPRSAMQPSRRDRATRGLRGFVGRRGSTARCCSQVALLSRAVWADAYSRIRQLIFNLT